MAKTSMTRDAFARPSSSAVDHFQARTGTARTDHFRTAGGRSDVRRTGRDAFAPAGVKKQAVSSPASGITGGAVRTPSQPLAEAPRAILNVVRGRSGAGPGLRERSQQAVLQAGGGDSRARAGASVSRAVFAPAQAGTSWSLDVVSHQLAVRAGASAQTPQILRPTPVAAAPDNQSRPAGGSSGRTRRASAARQPGPFNQDDFAGLLLGLAVIIFLMLWLLRGRDQAAIPGEDTQVLPQSVGANASPAAPRGPAADPFGDFPVDLKPKGPVPGLPQEAAPSEAEPLQSSLAPTSSSPGGGLPPVSPFASVQPAVSQSPPTPAAAAGLSAPLTLPAGGAPAASAWFCTGSSTLSDAARSEILRRISLQSARNGDAVIVHAYADTRGSSVYNLALSGARARVVADFLRTNGLTVIEAEGMGEAGGIADNLDCANQRRADVFFRSERALQPSVSCMPPPEATVSACL